MEKEVSLADEIAGKFGINLDNLSKEQKKFAKLVSLRDGIDFSLVENAAGCSNFFLGNQIVSSIVVCNTNFEIIEKKYAVKRAEFPYLTGFRAYRELPAMVECFKKLQEVCDVIFVEGHGIAHPRGFGIASHLGIAVQKPTVGIAQKLLEGEVVDSKIMLNGKRVGACIITKEGSRPIYISPGNMISVKTAVEITKKFLKPPHKLPEPLVMARKYSDIVREELSKKTFNRSKDDISDKTE